MKKYIVISGGPCSGKSSVINEIKKRGYKTIPEAARIISQKGEFKGKLIKEMNIKKFQNSIFELQKKELENSEGLVFSDRGFGDTFAYYLFNNLKIPNEFFEYAKRNRYFKIFILDVLKNYHTDEFRKESKLEAEKIHKFIEDNYKKLGYKTVRVPFMSIKKRVDFILGNFK